MEGIATYYNAGRNRDWRKIGPCPTTCHSERSRSASDAESRNLLLVCAITVHHWRTSGKGTTSVVPLSRRNVYALSAPEGRFLDR